MRGPFVVLIGILLGGGLFVAGSGPRSVPQVAPAASSEPAAARGADMLVRHMRLTAQGKTARAWRVNAAQAMFFEQEETVRVQEVEAHLSQASGEALHLTAARGQLHSKTGDLVVEGDVRLTRSDGILIKTERLQWHASKHVLSTDRAVTLRSQSVSVRGTGLRSQIDQQQLIVPHGVHASLRLITPP